MVARISLFIWSILMGVFFMFHIFIDMSYEEFDQFDIQVTHVVK